MNHSRLLLIAIVILLIAGGSLAFKTKHYNGNSFCKTSPDENVLCSIKAHTASSLLPGYTIGYCTVTTTATRCTPPKYFSTNA